MLSSSMMNKYSSRRQEWRSDVVGGPGDHVPPLLAEFRANPEQDYARHRIFSPGKVPHQLGSTPY